MNGPMCFGREKAASRRPLAASQKKANRQPPVAPIKPMRTRTLAPLLALLVLTACGTPSAVPHNAPDDLQATAAWDSYRLAAQATQTTSAQEAEFLARSIAATAQVATTEAGYAAATYAAQSTRTAIEATATFQSYQATATIAAAQATSTAEAVQVTATFQAGQATATAVAQATQNSIQTTATAQAAAATATTQAAAAEQEVLRLEREKKLQPLKTYGPWIIGAALAILTTALGSWAVLIAVRAWDARQRLVPTGPFGRTLFIQDGPSGQRTIVDPGRMFGPVVEMRPQGTTMPQLAAPELQNMTTARSQAVELRQAFHPPYPILMQPNRNTGHIRQLSAPTHAPVRDQAQFQPPVDPALPPPDAPWSLFSSWQGSGIPLGLGATGMLTINPEDYPHLLMAGMTGSGKTRYGLRPLISSALADGWQVVIYDRSGLDFLPFQDHPNAHTILLPQAEAAIDHLAVLYEVIQQRLTYLRQHRTSTWGRLPASSLSQPHPPRLMAVVEEFANLADALDGKQREALWRGARMIAAEGRKAGVHLALALQDPTHKSIDLRIRRNTTSLAFRVKDPDASRVVLSTDGAEKLRERQFLVVLDKLVRGVAFAPSDKEIRAYLASRPVVAHATPPWLAETVRATGSVSTPMPVLTPQPFIAPVPREVVQSGALTGADTGAHQPHHAELGRFGGVETPVRPLELVLPPEPDLPLPTNRPPAPTEQAFIRRLAGRGLSRNRICQQVYGFKNTKILGWINDALAELDEEEDEEETPLERITA